MNISLRQIQRIEEPEAHLVPSGKTRYMGMLAEAVILQAMEDLWNEFYREESVAFFRGAGFSWYAHIAGMSPYEGCSLLSLIKPVQKKMDGSEIRLNDVFELKS